MTFFFYLLILSLIECVMEEFIVTEG